ncbi:hypothetical protein RJ639_037959 [Escallonia herrerae]|uniref:Bet v I/Major latex protein domain-containing protein n=1 Tax=Escallonia herrerae TaxID=1293975 RepID=A0AA89BA77_9ASTE|nr:hypothetical protein RJ639_037959 [Escallonia herrerae]
MDLDYTLQVDTPALTAESSTEQKAITTAIRGAIRDSDNAKIYLCHIEEQFQSSSKGHASTLITKMVTLKYRRSSNVRTTVCSSYEEMYTKVDDEKMIKEAEVISGGYLDLGFTLYRTRFEILETSKTSCITKTTIEYDVNEEDVSILPMISMMKDFATYLLENMYTKN